MIFRSWLPLHQTEPNTGSRTGTVVAFWKCSSNSKRLFIHLCCPDTLTTIIIPHSRHHSTLVGLCLHAWREPNSFSPLSIWWHWKDKRNKHSITESFKINRFNSLAQNDWIRFGYSSTFALTFDIFKLLYLQYQRVNCLTRRYSTSTKANWRWNWAYRRISYYQCIALP